MTGVRTAIGDPPSPKQRQTLDFVAEFIARNGHSPSVYEIARDFGGISTNAVLDLLIALEKKGYLTRKPKLARTIALTPLGAEWVARRRRPRNGTSIDKTSPVEPGQCPHAAVASAAEKENEP